MFRTIILEILKQEQEVLIIGLSLLIISRFIYFKNTRKKLIFYKEVLLLLFVSYLICLFYVISFEDVQWSTSNFIPFKEITRYPIGSKLFLKNVIGNIIMFVPLGFFLGYFLKIKKKKWLFLLVILCSTLIECMQDVIGRVFDIDDILLNVVGGFLGYLTYDDFDKMKKQLPSILKKNFIYNIIVVILLVIFICYLTNVIGGSYL